MILWKNKKVYGKFKVTSIEENGNETQITFAYASTWQTWDLHKIITREFPSQGKKKITNAKSEQKVQPFVFCKLPQDPICVTGLVNNLNKYP